MEITEQDIKRASLITLVLALAILAFLVIKPVILSIFGGLLLAYIFFPVYKRILKYVRYKNISAISVVVIVLLLISVPTWFLAPLIIQRVFELFQFSQYIDVGKILTTLFPGISEEIITRASVAIHTGAGKITSIVLNALTNFIVNFLLVGLHLILVGFVFFFALRDEEKLSEFVSGLSPLNKNQEKILINQFKDTTNSIIYGQIIVGFFQGILAGIGLLIFGVPSALILTIISVILGIIPAIGVGFVYIPVTIFLLVSGNTALGIGYLVYNLLIVSTADNIIRAHIVSRKTQLSQALVLIGMIGGALVFGILGLILGPLIIGYFITFLRAYKEKNLSSFFAHE